MANHFLSLCQQDGDTALHLAAFDKPDVSNHLICVKLLLSQPGVNPLVMNKKGVTPLAHAAIGVRIMYQNIAERILRFPVHKYVKVVLCGHSGAGKSTLTQVGQSLKTIMLLLYSSDSSLTN